MSVRWLTHEEQQHWRAYLKGMRLLWGALEQDLSPYGVQLSEYEILVELSESPTRSLRMWQVAERTSQSRSRLTHTAARLETRGWVRRELAAGDRRGVDLVLTNEGWNAMQELAPAHVASVRARLVDLLTPEQLAALGQAMATVRDGVLAADNPQAAAASS